MNGEGYSDPTHDEAMRSIAEDRAEFVRKVLEHTRETLRLCNIRLEWIQAKDMKTGKRYKAGGGSGERRYQKRER